MVYSINSSINKSGEEMQNPFKEMSDEICRMQNYFANLDPEVKKEPAVKDAVLHLLWARAAIEKLWVMTTKKS